MSLLSLVRREARPRVIDLAVGRVSVERGDLATLGTPRRLALIAHFSTEPRVSLSTRTLVRELAAARYRVVVISASSTAGELDWNGDLPENAIVLRQPNLGYDFGSWAIGLDAVGPARGADYVILANDSLVGPFSTLAPLLAQFERAVADVWALTDTHQYFHHLQSYFLGFRGGVLSEAPLARFWEDIRVEPSKWDVIRNNELGLSRYLYGEGYQMTAAFRSEHVVSPGDNPVIKAWWKLMGRGFPFVKREIVRDPAVAPMGDRVAEEVSATFGQRLDDWL
jgi:lipopolysaccharide biosynthesis protein